MVMSVPVGSGSNCYGNFEHEYDIFKNNYTQYNPDRPFTQILYNIFQCFLCK